MSFVVDIVVVGERENLKKFNSVLKGDNGYSFANIVPMDAGVGDIKSWRQDNWGCSVDLNENETFDVINCDEESLHYRFYSYLFGTPLVFMYHCARKYPDLIFKIAEESDFETYTLVFKEGKVSQEIRSDGDGYISYIEYSLVDNSIKESYYREDGAVFPEIEDLMPGITKYEIEEAVEEAMPF